jgi:hypothetical protein
MKKILFCGVVLFLALAAVAFAGREEIDEALNSYEAIVTEAETLTQTDPWVASDEYGAIDEKAGAADTAIEAVAEDREWLIEDVKRASELRTRFNAAMASVIQKLLRY